MEATGVNRHMRRRALHYDLAFMFSPEREKALQDEARKLQADLKEALVGISELAKILAKTEANTTESAGLRAKSPD
jgi:hypothetical protein